MKTSGGRAHRREISGNDNPATGDMYQWLKANSYPDGFQILCFNCNCAKGAYGECPHTGSA